MTIYAKLGIIAQNEDGKVKHIEKYFEFVSEEHLDEIADDILFDNIIHEIDESLQQDEATRGYCVDDCIELVERPSYIKPDTLYPIWQIQYDQKQFIGK